MAMMMDGSKRNRPCFQMYDIAGIVQFFYAIELLVTTNETTKDVTLDYIHATSRLGSQ